MKELTKPGKVAQTKFCRHAEIIMDKIKVTVIAKNDSQSVIQAIQEAEDVVVENTKKFASQWQ